MGIKNLLKFLNSYPDLIETTNIDKFSGKKIAIDISILLYQIIISVRNSGADLTNKKGEITSHILGLFNKTINLLSKKIIPIYVFDGRPPQLKKKILDMRKKIRKKAEDKMNNADNLDDKIKYFKRSVIINKNNLDDCRELLDLMGIPYINAPEEADSQCAWLAKNGYVDSVLTEDMDILTFGSPSIIRNLTSVNKNPLEIKLNKIKEKFNWTQDEFIYFCILLGCDYCDRVGDNNCFELFKNFQKSKNIDSVLKEYDKYIEYKNTFEYFKNPLIEKKEFNFKIRKPNFNHLNDLLVNKYGLIKWKIKRKLEKLRTSYIYFNNNSNVASLLHNYQE